MITLHHQAPAARVQEAVLFPFDDHSIPFSAGVRLHMVPGKPPGIKPPIVVGKGAPSTADDRVVRFYGTIIPIDGELRMWYLGGGSLYENGAIRPMYATSRDGVNWEKPALGLVEYGGNRNNNVLDFRGGTIGMSALPVLYDPDDPNPDRRFKVAFEADIYGNCLAVGFSPDGLRWTVPDWNPVAPMLEQTGIIKFNGCYYVNGQGGRHFGAGRKLVTFASYDFERWTQATSMGFRRDNVPPRAMPTEWNSSEEVHLGAGVWDRGNVLIGIYDMWHGHPTGDRTFITMDLGIVVSNDALHYREPVPDFKIIPAREEIGSPPGRGPSISHGQGMLNWGEKTMLWYELWGLGDIRLATWPRDRLGYFQQYEYPRRPAAYAVGQTFRDVVPHFISCPIWVDGEAQVHVNVDGTGANSHLKVEVLDEQFRPLPGYSGEACVPVQENGLRQQVRWHGHDSLPASGGPFRIQVTFDGVRPEDVKLYAVYVG